jgi:Peptidase M15
MITLEQYLTSGGRYKDRANSPECTQEVKDNAIKLISKVNLLLKDLNITIVDISSGFRTSGANAATSNAAKKSLHMSGLAVDILDNANQDLAKLIVSKPELLEKYDLWIEDPQATKGKNTNWCHLDIGNRSTRPIRMFRP